MDPMTYKKICAIKIQTLWSFFFIFFDNDCYTSIYKHQHWIKDEANFIPWIALIAKFPIVGIDLENTETRRKKEVIYSVSRLSNFILSNYKEHDQQPNNLLEYPLQLESHHRGR